MQDVQQYTQIEYASQPPNLYVLDGGNIGSEPILEMAFRIYHQCKLVSSQQEFSTAILGKKPSYYSCMRARKRAPSREVLERLLSETRRFKFICASNPLLGNAHAKQINKTYQSLSELSNTINDELSCLWMKEGKIQ